MLKILKLTRAFVRLKEPVQPKFASKHVSIPMLYVSRSFSNESPKNDANKIDGINESINIAELTQNDPEVEKRLRVIALEADLLRQETGRVPSLTFLKASHWKELLEKPTRSQRLKYFTYLFKLEKKNENKKAKKEKAREELENRPPLIDDGHLRYGLNHNTIFIRIYDTTINHFYNSRLINAAQFGQKIVVDCGYDKNMTSRECQNCAKQVMLLFSENRVHDDPFDLHLCNVEKSGKTMEALQKYIPTMYEPWFPLNVHESSYLDLFPRDRLVYLTPHCRDELEDYDHDAVYVIGAIVDKLNNDPLSMAKAKREGLKMRKLPLDRYLQWGSGSGKSLTLNQCISILLDVKVGGDWEKALRHVPRRKILAEGAAPPPNSKLKRQPSARHRDFVKNILKN